MTINDHVEIEDEGKLSPYQADHMPSLDELLAGQQADDSLVKVGKLRDRLKTMKQRMAQRREEIEHLQTEAKYDEATYGMMVGELHAALDELVKEAGK